MKAASIRVGAAQLCDERDELLTRLDGCREQDCPHHGDDVHLLDTVLWLLDGAGEGE